MYSVKKISINDSSYPPLLLRLKNPPKVLFYRGPLPELLTTPRLAIVGSRKLTTYGQHITDQLANAVARRGVTIVSGLALGADGMAHQAALTAGTPTIAVLPCSIDLVYPRTHTNLAERILAQGGALVSEYEPTMEPHKGSFIARNRIIAALADATFIPEASSGSGSLHTAAYTQEISNTVLAAPGLITSNLSEGTNQLIKDGAVMVTKASDILDALGIQPMSSGTRQPHDDTPEAQILALLSTGVTDASALLHASALDARHFQATLTMLEIQGHVRSNAAGSWELV